MSHTVALRPGMKKAVSSPFQGKPNLVHDESKTIVAAFKQNPARYIKPGEAEVALQTIPGHATELKVVDALTSSNKAPSHHRGI